MRRWWTTRDELDKQEATPYERVKRQARQLGDMLFKPDEDHLQRSSSTMSR
jgi:hypothetical protein